MHDTAIFCHPGDQVAKALFENLRGRSFSVLMVTAEDLSFAQWKHTIDAFGKCRTQIILPNGCIINSEKLKAAFNRIKFLPMLHFASHIDRQYAEMEIFAVYVSFLKGINHLLINPVKTNYLTLQEENDFLLMKLAADAGFMIAEYHFTSSPKWRGSLSLNPFDPHKNSYSLSQKRSPHLVRENKCVLFKEHFTKVFRLTIVGSNVFGDTANNYETAARRLSKGMGTPFFELQMVQTAAGYKLGAVNKFPVYGDTRVIEALTSMIERKFGLSQ